MDALSNEVIFKLNKIFDNTEINKKSIFDMENSSQINNEKIKSIGYLYNKVGLKMEAISKAFKSIMNDADKLKHFIEENILNIKHLDNKINKIS